MELSVDHMLNTMNVEFIYYTHSLYSGEPSVLVLPDWCSAFSSRSEEYYEDEYDTYNPLVDRFIVSGIQVNEKSYLQRDGILSFSYPEAAHVKQQCEVAILHGPDILHGQHDKHFLLGVVSSVHNKLGVIYNWFKDNIRICSGPNLCLLKVSEPGDYFCEINYKDATVSSMTANVKALQSSLLSKEVSSQGSEASYPHSVSIDALLRSNKMLLKD